MSDDDDTIKLTKGSLYRIQSMGTRDKTIVTEGTYKGFVGFGATGAIAMELGEFHEELSGTVRILPGHMILTLDILEQAEEEKKMSEKERMDPSFY